MAITRLTAPSITGLTIPNTSINNASLDSVTALPGGIDVGKIGQVINQTSTVDLSTTSTSYSSIFSASITPSSTSSKILITHTAPTYINLSNTSNMGVEKRWWRYSR
jgi:hypothetical protein